MLGVIYRASRWLGKGNEERQRQQGKQFTTQLRLNLIRPIVSPPIIRAAFSAGQPESPASQECIALPLPANGTSAPSPSPPTTRASVTGPAKLHREPGAWANANFSSGRHHPRSSTPSSHIFGTLAGTRRGRCLKLPHRECPHDAWLKPGRSTAVRLRLRRGVMHPAGYNECHVMRGRGQRASGQVDVLSQDAFQHGHRLVQAAVLPLEAAGLHPVGHLQRA